ncbi:ABC transporter ATP-binding protein [Luteipulveratus mongoliensis]|uniref:Peptide ABC transporter ATPase n=1 Tax=Luteipulveratus mongoliensis TaxID=571913 RepID=A0A0K1JK71_9MICO|nr:ABC transporter ATP-binding protein [Luteipulveratus mongoliensis]AKU17117.1 peptide ABC transporter ATPase [Luteipulveratus mongoliensis]
MTRDGAEATVRPVLDVRGLSVVYDGETPVRAVTDVSFTVRPGEILGLAGESGCGKSTILSAIAQLNRPPARTTAGSVLFGAGEGPPVDLLSLSQRELSAIRWEELAVVFQSAMDALNPVTRLSTQFVDVLRLHRGLSRSAAKERAAELLGVVGIPASRLRSYPHELSGGMRQRATIALALACDPSIVLMDEPTTAVDVVMQRQILEQVTRLRRELGFAVVFVTHDMSLLLEIADRIAIMYAGRIVEMGAASEIYRDPKHPYTKGLRDSFPPLSGPRREIIGITGSPPDPRRLPSGCSFHPRCPEKVEACEKTRPPLLGDERNVACLLHSPTSEEVVSVER